MKASVSARKIGANLWEVQPLFNFKKLDSDHDDGDQRHHSYNKEGLLGEEPSKNSQPVKPYARAITPMGHTLKTSTRLLKVRNQISNLEEQHSRNKILIKSLKRDLDISRAQIKTLLEERKRDHQEIKELKRSTKDELLEVKSAFRREKKTRILLESLCDEFAKEIRDYEQKVTFLRQDCREKDQIVGSIKPDRLILHVSEAWLDERLQMKLDFAEKPSISDKLCREIETFLEAKRKQSHGSGVEVIEDCEENRLCGVLVEPSSESLSRKIDWTPGPTETSLKSMSRMTGQGSGVTEPSSQKMPRTTVQAPGVVESSNRRARVGVKANTLMAKLIEARLESQFSKSRKVRR